MGEKPDQSPAVELKRQVVHRTRHLLALATQRLGTRIPNPGIRFDLRGKIAGQVRTRNGDACTIRYNVQLLARDPENFLAQTVPHETAHVIVFFLFGSSVKPHGEEWKATMRLFGAVPDRCHSYDVSGLQTRHLRRYDYRCACRTHSLTSIRHNRVRAGQVYVCRLCGQPLEPRAP